MELDFKTPELSAEFSAVYNKDLLLGIEKLKVLWIENNLKCLLCNFYREISLSS